LGSIIENRQSRKKNMKIRKILIFALLSSFFLMSCASTPDDAEETGIEPPKEVSVEESRAAADAAREAAIEVKAPRAASEKFESAQALFDQAADVEKQGDNEKAAGLYDDAAEGFQASAAEAVQAREDAEAAMAAADRAIADSEAAADEAVRETSEDN
jgi:hypothetical protein